MDSNIKGLQLATEPMPCPDLALSQHACSCCSPAAVLSLHGEHSSASVLLADAAAACAKAARSLLDNSHNSYCTCLAPCGIIQLTFAWG